jgi:hypothetical protein
VLDEGGTSVVVDVVLEPLLGGRGEGAGISVVLGDARSRFAGEVVPSIDNSVTGWRRQRIQVHWEEKQEGKREEKERVSFESARKPLIWRKRQNRKGRQAACFFVCCFFLLRKWIEAGFLRT